tara:strand:+ start:885 stop:1562 length:678 start_codon:yes stop_codon:yes gene_type:complete
MASIDDLKTIATTKLGFARNNQFLVQLPAIGQGTGFLGFLGQLFSLPSIPGTPLATQPTTKDLNILCSTAQIPGKQILTSDRKIGMEMQKIAYGYAVPDVNLTFHLMNDYGIKTYFDAWIKTAVDEENGTVAYKNEYQKSIKIHQLRRPVKGFSKNVGPLNLNLELGGGSVYVCELLEAFPTTISTIDLSNELDGMLQLSVSFSYTRWKANDVTLDGLINFSTNI